MDITTKCSLIETVTTAKSSIVYYKFYTDSAVS